ncbi:flagellar export protein FliJ [uncultured Helicobacter sp.]|uniref:flagellar export protein FliJ n=1 Tax=uncultured Helicobacter sp. TaxID=175537 RepID=UPI002610DC4F|nr:flagellar export protein FliJ [uncultured Helicobacter sp.]
MKTQFDALIKAQEQKLNMCELQIVRANNQVASKQSEMSALVAELARLQRPDSGSFDTFLKANARKRAFVFEIDSIQEGIAILKAQIAALESQHRSLYVEFEKLKHIREKQREEMVKAMKQKEQKELDEVAILLHKKELL